jgi:hypothetical protein
MRRLTLASFLLALVACGEVTEPVAPEATELNPSAPAFNFSNGPPHPGKSVVFRGGVPVIWIGTDPARDLLSVNGLGTLDPSQSWPCVFPAGEPPDILEFQNAVTKGGITSHAVMENPTQHIYAGLANFGSQPTFCDALKLPRVAEGIGDHFRFNTNCSFDAPCDRGVRTEGWRARGTLTDLVNGGKVRYTEVQRVHIDPETGDVKVLVENIRLMRIGKP